MTERVLPSFDIALPDGRLRTVSGATTATTVGDLAERLDLDCPSAGELLIDGRRTLRSAPLATSGVRHGSLVGPVAPVAPDRSGERGTCCEATCCEVIWMTGPDAGGRVVLGPGEHVIGRSPLASIRCDDPDLELHHALLVVADGSVTVHQLSGRVPLVIDGVPLDNPVARPVVLADRARIELGASVLRIGIDEPVVWPAAVTGAADARDPWRVAHIRVPRSLVGFVAEPVTVPADGHAPSGMAGTLWPTLLAVAASGVLAIVLGQVMFVMFGLLGAVVALGTWVAQRVGLVRSRTRATAARSARWNEFATALAAQRIGALIALHANAPTIVRSLAVMRHDRRALWSVRAADDGAFRVSVGEGQGRWEPVLVGEVDASAEVWNAVESAARLGVVPVVASLAAGNVLAIAAGTERERAAVARSMIVQLAAASGPADWRLLIVGEEPAWRELDWLVHLADDGGRRLRSTAAQADAVVSGLDAADDRHLVVLLDRPDLLRTRTSSLRRLMATGRSVAVVVLCPTEAEVPACCTSMLVIGHRGHGRWSADTAVHALAEPVRIAGVAAARAAEAVRSIAHLRDPERVDAGAGVPTDVGLVELCAPLLGNDVERYPHAIADHWSRIDADPPPCAPIGIAADGVVELDLERDGPHGLIAGTTGSGKSELLRSLVLGLAVHSRPELLGFVLVDYKGGATFDGLADLPHVVGLVTDLDDRLAGRALRSLEAELRRRERLLREAGVADLGEHRRAVDAGRVAVHLARLVVVIDEFAGLAIQQPAFLSALVGIAQRGRSLGVHLLLATQRPAGVVSDDIRANTQLRIALRVHDAADAVDVIGDPAAARLPRAVPGRAMMRLAADELVSFQTARCTRPLGRGAGTALTVLDPDGDGAIPESDGPAPAAQESTVLVRAVVAAAALVGSAPSHRPWLAPLERHERFDRGVMDDSWVDSIGVVDDPDHQRRLPLRVPVDGHVLLVGAVGSGTTTAALAVAATLARDGDVYVLDGLGDDRIEHLGGAACVVRLHERERVHRLLAHLAAVIADRAGGAAVADGQPPRCVVLVIDGYGALRSALERDDEWARLDALDHIVADGPACGVRCVLTATRPGAVPAAALAHVAHRWVFHLDEPLEGSLAGVPAHAVPGAVPGRLVVAATGLEAQVFVPCGSPMPPKTHSTAPAIRTLPPHIDLADLAELALAPVGEEDVVAPVGVSFETLGTAVLRIGIGEHALVVGPARSGRTTALRTIAASWRRARPAGRIVSIAPRRSSAMIGEVVDVGRALGAVDEAIQQADDLLVVVDDAELVDDPSGRLSALVAARPEHVTVVAAGRPEALRTAYGHWTTAVRRARLGLVMASCTDLDADLLGASLPRRTPIQPRPGLAWIVADGGQQLVQIAVPGERQVGPDDRSTDSLDAVGTLP